MYITIENIYNKIYNLKRGYNKKKNIYNKTLIQ